MDISRFNYETYFLLYLDRELNPEDKQEVENFLKENADLQKEFSLLQQTVFSPDEMVFEQKESLLHKEEKRRVISMYRMRIAAAVTLLIMSGWFVKTRIAKNNNLEVAVGVNTKQVKKESAVTIDLPVVKNTINRQPSTVNRQPSTVNRQPSSIIRQPSTVNRQPSTVNRQPSSIIRQPSTVSNPDLQNDQTNLVSEEALIAVQKSSTALEVQSAGIQSAKDPKQMAELPGKQAPALLLTISAIKDQIKYENETMNEPDFQNDNAISVIALNDQNKGIAGFFKKLTKRAPADDNQRKVRVSVFQFSY